jgi:hypothetical protein
MKTPFFERDLEEEGTCCLMRVSRTSAANGERTDER